MFRAVINWFKWLFSCCFPIRNSHAKPSSKDYVLLVEDDKEIYEDHSSAADSTIVIVSALQPQPVRPEPKVSLSANELKQVLEDAYCGKNTFIDALPSEKKAMAHKLIKKFLNIHMKHIDESLTDLSENKVDCTRIKRVWWQIKTSYQYETHCESSLEPSCEAAKIASPEQSNLIDKVVNLYHIFKNILNLNIFKNQANRNAPLETPTPRSMTDVMLDEPTFNRRTIQALNNFNRRCEEYAKEEAEAENTREKTGWKYG